MSPTKRQLIQLALEEIGISSNEFDITPAEFESALRRLDAMMADWNARGIRVSYPLSSIENSSLTQDSGVPDSANDAIISNLALKLAASFGKQVPREVKVSAKNGYNTLLMRAGVTDPVEKQFPSTLPLGAGHKSYRNQRGNFMPTPTDPVDAGPDSVLDYN